MIIYYLVFNFITQKQLDCFAVQIHDPLSIKLPVVVPQASRESCRPAPLTRPQHLQRSCRLAGPVMW